MFIPHRDNDFYLNRDEPGLPGSSFFIDARLLEVRVC